MAEVEADDLREIPRPAWAHYEAPKDAKTAAKVKEILESAAYTKLDPEAAKEATKKKATPAAKKNDVAPSQESTESIITSPETPPQSYSAIKELKPLVDQITKMKKEEALAAHELAVQHQQKAIKKADRAIASGRKDLPDEGLPWSVHQEYGTVVEQEKPDAPTWGDRQPGERVAEVKTEETSKVEAEVAPRVQVKEEAKDEVKEEIKEAAKEESKAPLKEQVPAELKPEPKVEEVKAEVKPELKVEEAKVEVKEEAKAEAKPESKIEEAKVEVKEEVKAEAKPETKIEESKVEVKEEVKVEVKEEAKAAPVPMDFNALITQILDRKDLSSAEKTEMIRSVTFSYCSTS